MNPFAGLTSVKNLRPGDQVPSRRVGKRNTVADIRPASADDVDDTFAGGPGAWFRVTYASGLSELVSGYVEVVGRVDVTEA